MRVTNVRIYYDTEITVAVKCFFVAKFVNTRLWAILDVGVVPE